jgi:predicted Fe-Mo cluster-binding NifX family protein
VVKLLLEKGADVTVVNNRGGTPLISASYNGHIDMVKLLLERGADVTVADNVGWTPLNAASSRGHVDVVKLLLEKDADVTAADNVGWTPLNAASSRGHVDVVKLLLEKGADVIVANNEGGTPLISASSSGHVDVVKLLLEKDADVTAADNAGWSAQRVQTLQEDSGYSGSTRGSKREKNEAYRASLSKRSLDRSLAAKPPSIESNVEEVAASEDNETHLATQRDDGGDNGEDSDDVGYVSRTIQRSVS